MTHLRKSIRDETVAILTGLTTTGTNVFDTRIFPIAQTSLPCLAVYADEEDSELVSNSGSLERALTLRVSAYARQVANVEDQLDLIAEEVETALTAITDVKRLTLINTSVTYSDEGDAAIATMVLTFAAYYFTKTGAPGVSN